MTETAKKKRGMPSSFTILLALLAIVAVITVIVSGTSGGAVTAARLSDFCTAPIKGFADALPVCLFVDPGRLPRHDDRDRRSGQRHRRSGAEA